MTTVTSHVTYSNGSKNMTNLDLQAINGGQSGYSRTVTRSGNTLNMVNNGAISGSISGGSISGNAREMMGSSNNGGTATYGYTSSSRQV